MVKKERKIILRIIPIRKKRKKVRVQNRKQKTHCKSTKNIKQLIFFFFRANRRIADTIAVKVAAKMPSEEDSKLLTRYVKCHLISDCKETNSSIITVSAKDNWNIMTNNVLTRGLRSSTRRTSRIHYPDDRFK